MPMVTIRQAKTHLSRPIASVGKGEEIAIARGRHPVAKLAPAGKELPLVTAAPVFRAFAVETFR